MIAVVIGSTGLVGNLLVQQLLNDPEIFNLISISRKPLSYHHLKLKQILLQDLSELPAHNANMKGDYYFCCLGTTIKDAGSQQNFEKIDRVAVLDFAKIARDFDAKCFSVISAYGAHSQSRVYYNRVKGSVEEALKQLHFKRLVIFKPSLLMGTRKAFRLGERVAIEIVKVISFVLPTFVSKRLGTNVDLLASRLQD